MAGKGYSVDDILEEVRRKKQKETAAKAGTEIQGDFFEMRQKNAVPEKKEEQAPTYTKKYNTHEQDNQRPESKKLKKLEQQNQNNQYIYQPLI